MVRKLKCSEKEMPSICVKSETETFIEVIVVKEEIVHKTVTSEANFVGNDSFSASQLIKQPFFDCELKRNE